MSSEPTKSYLKSRLIFDRGAPGRSGRSIPPSTVPEVDVERVLGDLRRQQAPRLAEVSEPEVVRHYVQLSQQNFAIDKTFYPLGSCTMKYNPKVNEWAARLKGFASLHPYMDAELAEGAFELRQELEAMLADICGLEHVSLHPSAGAQGELVGLMMIMAYHRSQGRHPTKVLIPDTAHGTNPASCALNGLDVVVYPTGASGTIEAGRLASLIDEDVAAFMVTNPSTVGLFEAELPEVAKRVHESGGLVYGDGANLNALMGRVRPGDLGIDVMQFNLHKTFTTPHGGGGPGCGPVAFRTSLAPFAPRKANDPVGKANHPLTSGSDDGSIGRVRAFDGNFSMMVRAYTYLREMGAEGLRSATDLAVLNANYLRVRLGERWHVPFERPCMHEVLISDRHLKETGVTTLDVAKRLLDYGFHPPTIYFPLVVKGAMLIEPTETETKETLDAFVDAMAAISDEAFSDPELVKRAPHTTQLRRVDEARAARQPDLRHQL